MWGELYELEEHYKALGIGNDGDGVPTLEEAVEDRALLLSGDKDNRLGLRLFEAPSDRSDDEKRRFAAERKITQERSLDRFTFYQTAACMHSYWYESNGLSYLYNEDAVWKFQSHETYRFEDRKRLLKMQEREWNTLSELAQRIAEQMNVDNLLPSHTVAYLLAYLDYQLRHSAFRIFTPLKKRVRAPLKEMHLMDGSYESVRETLSQKMKIGATILSQIEESKNVIIFRDATADIDEDGFDDFFTEPTSFFENSSTCNALWLRLFTIVLFTFFVTLTRVSFFF